MKTGTVFFLSLTVVFPTICENDSLNPGTKAGEKANIALQKQLLKMEIEGISAILNRRMLSHMAHRSIERDYFTEKMKHEPFFSGSGKNRFETANDINEFSRDLIRSRLNKKELRELLELTSRGELNMERGSKKIWVAKFGDEINEHIDHSNKSKSLYKELIGFLSENGKESDADIRASIIPFERGEIGIGLTDRTLTLKHPSGKEFEVWATTFGKLTPTNIKERGVRDIVLDRFTGKFADNFLGYEEEYPEQVIDKEDLKAEAADRTSGLIGTDKINQERWSIGQLTKTLDLTRNQVAYEGAFYAKLSEKLSDMAKTDTEDAALFIEMFYNNYFYDLSNMKPEKRALVKKWQEWLRKLSPENRNHFRKYLGLEYGLTENPLLEDNLSFEQVGTLAFEHQPFMFKQWHGKNEETPDGREKNALKFYYQNVLQRIGLHFEYDPTPDPSIPVNDPTRFHLDFKKNHDSKGVLKWKTTTINGETAVVRLGEDGNDDHYNAFLLFRAKKRFEWAKRFYDIAEMMKKFATGIEAMLHGGEFYRPLDNTAENTEFELVEASYREFDGGAFKSLKEYYDSLEDAFKLAESDGALMTPLELERQNLVILEKYWKIRTYRDQNLAGIENQLKEKQTSRNGGGKTTSRLKSVKEKTDKKPFVITDR